jgi:hypothetical protein
MVANVQVLRVDETVLVEEICVVLSNYEFLRLSGDIWIR